MALSGRYGFHGDELYMLDCARHLAASYVDQPVFAPLMAWVTLHLFGVSLPGLRLWAALATAGTVTIGGLTAREFGSSRPAGAGARRVPHRRHAGGPWRRPHRQHDALHDHGHRRPGPRRRPDRADRGSPLVAGRWGRHGRQREDNHLVAILAVALTI